MTRKNEPQWATGPGELIRHGVSLLSQDTDSARRIAFICIDNAVELMMKTFLTLPKRITGLEISRRERDELTFNFVTLLDGVERYAEDYLDGINLGEIEWFHRLRNELYHQGNGLTVEKQKVEAYAEIAKLFFNNLFHAPLTVDESTNMALLGEFMSKWAELEHILRKSEPDNSDIFVFRNKNFINQISNDKFSEINELRLLRNSFVPGVAYGSTKITRRTVDQLSAILDLVKKRTEA